MILNAHEKMIAKRYLVPVKGERFIFVVAGFSVGAVALGVGSSLVRKDLIRAGNWSEISRLAADYIRVVAEARAGR